MTHTRMALVPRTATNEMIGLGATAIEECASATVTGSIACFNAMTAAAPDAGKVSREQLKAAANAVAKHRNPYITAPQEGTKYDAYLARAVITSLGLEYEE